MIDMRILKSRNDKLSGKRINTLAAMAGMVGDKLPLSREFRFTDKNSVSMISVDGRGYPLMGGDATGSLELAHLNGVFSDGEEFDVHIEDNTFTLTNGKNRYWFVIVDDERTSFRMPEWGPPQATFVMDPRKVSKKYDKRMKNNGYAKFIAGYRKDGSKAVRVFLYDKDHKLLDAVDLETEWDGEPTSVRMSMDYLKKLGAMGKRTYVGITEDRPMIITSDDDDFDARFILAPLIQDDRSISESEDRQQEAWIASHNKRTL